MAFQARYFALTFTALAALSALSGCNMNKSKPEVINQGGLDAPVLARVTTDSLAPNAAPQVTASPVVSYENDIQPSGNFALASGDQSAERQSIDPAALIFDPIPPQPIAGLCYQRVLIPAKTQQQSKQVQIAAASREVEIIPAKYGVIEQEIVVKQAAEELNTIPATYKTITEEIVLRPAAQKVIKVPPRFENRTRQVLVTPAQQTWKRSQPLGSQDQESFDTFVLEEQAPVYQVITERVMVDPGGTKLETIPAETTLITREVIDQPARVERRVVPAQTKKIKRQVIVEPAREVIVENPAQFTTVTQNQVIEPARNAWVSVLCETSNNKALIKQVQTQLAQLGLYRGKIDGIVGNQTRQALTAFQKARGLMPYGFTLESLQALNVQI